MERLGEIFKHQSLCQSLYERSSVGISAYAFERLIKTAAANANERRTVNPSTHASPVSNKEVFPPTNSNNNVGNLVAAFCIRSSPRHRRPFLYRRGDFNNNRRSNFPQALRRFRDNNRNVTKCFGCRQEGHIIRDCPKRQKYIKLI